MFNWRVEWWWSRDKWRLTVLCFGVRVTLVPRSVWICCEVEVVLGGGHVVQHEIDELEIEVVAVGVESVGDLQTRGATMFVVGSICMVMRLRCSDLERGGTCIEYRGEGTRRSARL